MTEETQTLDETLEKTDLGHIINENKNKIMIAGVIIVAAIVGFALYQNQMEKKMNERLSAAYTFETEVVSLYMDGKLTKEQYLEKANAMGANIKGEPTLLPSFLGSIDKLVEQGAQKEALALLETWKDQFAPSSLNYFFYGLKLSALYEDAGKNSEAIEVLNKLVAINIKDINHTLYLSMGRNSLKMGDKDNATQKFNYILEKFKDTQSAKMAKYYLSKIK